MEKFKKLNLCAHRVKYLQGDKRCRPAEELRETTQTMQAGGEQRAQRSVHAVYLSLQDPSRLMHEMTATPQETVCLLCNTKEATRLEVPKHRGKEVGDRG